ncbi:5-hydroxytryptamine receptor 3A-like [Eleutherodactylus coqui]|uniref:5-hydroxytryptamine receptor 3A-like n=1 Tax=Eleutherodactylus coqui TaxID=57060 RepID=UPI003461FD5F
MDHHRLSLKNSCSRGPSTIGMRVIENWMRVDPGKAAEDAYVYVHYNGRIYYSEPMQLKATCKFDIYYFPFDQHNCSLTFISLIHTIQDVNISIWKPEKESHNYTSEFTDFGEWDIISVSPSFNTVDYESCVSGETTFSLILRRKPLFYFINLIVPSILLMIMNIAGFYLPPESGERTSFKITLLLGYSVFLVIVSDKSPPTGTPLIGTHFTMCMVLIVISVMETIFIIRIIHQENCNRAVPKWVKTLVLEKMATLICLKKEDHFDTSHDDVSDILEQKMSSSSEILVNYRDENMKHCDKELPTTKDSEVLLRILKQIVSMQEGLKKITEQSVSREWIHIAHIIDTFVFRIYIIVVLVYMVAFSAVWFQWLHA